MCDFLVHRTHLYKPRLSSILSLSHHYHSSSSNHLLAVLRSDHSIELWNTHDSFTLERTIQPRNASHSPELVLWLEQYLITAGLDGQLIAYDPITFEILTSCHAAGGAIWSLAKHEITRRIAVGTETGHVNIYQLDEDASQFSLATSVCKQSARIVSLAWHTTDDDFLVAGSINRIYICSTRQKRTIQQINVGKLSSTSNRRGQKDTIIWCLAVTDDYTVFSGDSSGRTCVWDAVYGTLIRSFQTHRADVLCMTLSSDEQTLFCSGVDSVIVRIELVSPKSETTTSTTTTTTTTTDSTKQWIKTISIHSHSHDVRSLTLIPSRFASIRNKEHNLSNKLMLISGGLDARLLVHDIVRDNSKPPVLWRKCFNFTQHRNKIYQKGNYFLFTYRDYIELWSIGKEGGVNDNGEDILERAPKNLVQIKTKHQARVDTVAMTVKKSKDDEQVIIAMGDTNGLHVYVIQGLDIQSQLNVTPIKTYSDEQNIEQSFSSITNLLQLRFHSSSSLYALTSRSQLYCFSTSSYKLNRIISCLPSTLRFEVSSKYIATADRYGHVTIYLNSTYNILTQLPQETYQCTALSFNNDRLACAYADRSLIEYDIQQNEYSDWTRKYLKRMPLQWFSERSPIINLFYDTKDKLFVVDSTYLSIIERGKKMPGTYAKIFNSTNQTNSPIHVCKQFKYLLHVTLLSSTQLFVVELIPSSVEQCLPPALKRKRFGI
ncbi:unnamed protein product [Adineta steineri]|uniref:U3 small nucleolar RNA-associated protein 4 n=1 Tax=Adineta steineri TaxID=433720 RepID=A0A819CBI5_9BILA|nr:unnamed protein product [Adineta steineri]CAF3809132.1 unnamed protein product [Adineta steineri]